MEETGFQYESQGNANLPDSEMFKGKAKSTEKMVFEVAEVIKKSKIVIIEGNAYIKKIESSKEELPKFHK